MGRFDDVSLDDLKELLDNSFDADPMEIVEIQNEITDRTRIKDEIGPHEHI